MTPVKLWKKLLYGALYAVGVIALVLAVWAIAAAAVGSELVLPDIASTFRALGDVLKNSVFYSGLGGTLVRSCICYAISVALFFVLFALATAFKSFARIIEPLISALRSLPAVAVTLILVLVVGSRGTPIVLGVSVIMPMMYSSARARVSAVPRELEEVCLICGANRLQTLRALWLPCLASGLPDNFSSAFSYTVKTVLGAEILAQTAESLGMLMKLSQLYLQTSLLIALVIAAVVVSVVCEYALKAVLSIALTRYRD